ncbi:MAG: LCP family protein [Kosmotogaceae bacterium]
MVKLLRYLITITALFVLSSCIFFTVKSFVNYFEEQSLDESAGFIIVGKDSGGKLSSGGRTDFIVTLKKNEEDEFEIVSIPRDTLVKVEGEEHKINSIYLSYGIDVLAETIKELVNVSVIAGYMILDFETVIEITEFTGPIDVLVEDAMHHDDFQQDLHIHFEKGYHKLKGEQLLNYLRFRSDSEGDLGRIERQKDVLMKLVQKVFSLDIKNMYRTASFIMNETDNEFDFVPLISLMYSFVTNKSGLTINTLPYKIDENGNVIPIVERPMVDEEKEPRILIINNIPDFSRYGNFSQIVKGQWRKRTGFEVLTCDKIPELEIFETRKTYAFLNNESFDLTEKFKKAQPYHSAEYFATFELEGLGLYYRLREWIADQNIYYDYFDAIILLGVSQS